VPTDEEVLRGLVHRGLRWNTPLSEERADRLLGALHLDEARRIVDLGCGWGELLLKALEPSPRLTGEGVERDVRYVERARASADARGLASRVQFVVGDVVRYSGTAGRLICIGTEHAWGGAATALPALRLRVRPGGLLLYGGGFWQCEPSASMHRLFGTLPSSRPALAGLAERAGWSLVRLESADRHEWDEFESGWNQDLEELAVREGPSELGRQARRLLRARRSEYEDGYRGVLGFAYLVLKRPELPIPSSPATG
jgi:Methyltransferase small domain